MNYGELDLRPTFVLTRDLIKKSMPKFKRHDDLIVVQEAAWEEFKKSLPIPVVQEENSPFSIDEDELASLVCQTVQKPLCRRLAVEKGIKNDDYRTPNVDLVLGDTGIVNHKENQITYKFDVTKCMFSFGNINEKMRMGELDCSDEIVVDLFAGIGYFSLPLLIHANAKHLYACEWNPDAVDALKKNLILNKVDGSRYTVIEGDNRSNRPTDVAQRVVLGILPSSMGWMQTAFECIDKSTGAVLHCHDLVESKPPPPPPTPPAPEDDSKQASVSSFDATSSLDKQTIMNQSLFDQSISSSSSSHSTIEKLSVPSDERSPRSSESDKDTSSPVLLEKPTSDSFTNASTSPVETSSINLNESSSSSSHQEDSIGEPPQISEHELDVYEARGQALVDSIKEEVEAHDLQARVIHIQTVKSYAPHVNHVVFDIKIEPKSSHKLERKFSLVATSSNQLPEDLSADST